MTRSHIVSIDESQRQMILLALAHLAVERPGWKYALGETAKSMDEVVQGEPSLFSQFYDLRSKQVSDSLPEEPNDETFKTAIGVHELPPQPQQPTQNL